VRQLRLPACVGLSWACAKQGGRHTADRLLARNKQRVSLQVFDLLLTTLCQLHSRSCQRNNTPIAIINFRCHCALLAQRSAPHDPQQMSATQKEAAPSPPSPPLPHRPTTAHPHPAALLPHCHPRELLRATTPPARTATLYSSCRASSAPCIQALSVFAPPPPTASQRPA
jgi:hypothetical protein